LYSRRVFDPALTPLANPVALHPPRLLDVTSREALGDFTQRERLQPSGFDSRGTTVS